MPITIYKYKYHVSWDTAGVGVTVRTIGTSGAPYPDINSILANYYTKTQLQFYRQSKVHYSNIDWNGMACSDIHGIATVTGYLRSVGGMRGSMYGITTMAGFLRDEDHLEGITEGVTTVSGSLHPIFDVGSSVSFGTEGQVPYMNAGGNDFNYSSAFTFDGTNLGIGNAINFPSGNITIKYNASDRFVINETYNNILIGAGAGNGSITGSHNVASGYSTLNALTDGAYNTAVGSYALEKVTGNDYNTALGYGAGRYNYSANNTFIGYLSGRGADGSSTGNSNTFVGSNSGVALTTGSNNVGVGNSVMVENLAGQQNVAIGSLASRYNTGSENVIIGYAAGQGATGASAYTQNIIIGGQAGFSFRTGSNYNALLGYQSFYEAQTTATYNVGVGFRTGQFNFGSYNMFLGANAGKGVTGGGSTGSYNTCIGYNAGDSLTSGNYNLLIGYSVDLSSPTDSSVVRIGYNTKYLIEGSLATSTEWFGSTYPLKVNHIGEYTASHGVHFDNFIDFTGTIDGRIDTVKYLDINSAYNSVLIGLTAGNALTTQAGNVMIGYQAGKTASNANSNYNVILGYNNLPVSTYIQKAVIIGYNIGLVATIGPTANSVIIGDDICKAADAVGSQLVLIGSSIAANPTNNPGESVIVGYQAGVGISTSRINKTVFIGTFAGYNYRGTTYTDGNTAIGYRAMYGLATNTANTAIGKETLYSLTSGGSNTAIGEQALYYNQIGQYNVAIGMNAGRTTGGSNNVVIGATADWNGEVANSGNGNILIGYGVDKSTSTASYELRVGYTTTLILTGSTASGSEFLASPYQFKVDHIGEYTASHGVDVDGVLIKDSNISLDYIGPPSGDWSMTLANKQLKFTWVAPVTADGAMELEVTGAFTGDVLHIHQHTGNPGAGTHLIHLEAADADVVPLYVSSAATLSAEFTKDVTVYGITFGRGGTAVSSNLAIGASVLEDNTTGNNSVGIGYYALKEQTEGNANLAIGAQSMQNNTDGDSNIAIGYNSMWQYSGFNYNVGIGINAFAYITTGASYNIGIGNGVGAGLTDGDYNIIIGGSTAPFINGIGNVFIGHESAGAAGYDNSYCVFIGYQAGYHEDYGQRLIIDGLGGRGSQALARAGALIYGEFNATASNQILQLGGGGQIYFGDGASSCYLSVDDTETYVVAVDPTTGLLSRRAVSSLGGTTPTDDILDWSTDKYTPWSDANKAAGRFYAYTSTYPTNSTALAYDGHFYAMSLRSGNSTDYSTLGTTMQIVRSSSTTFNLNPGVADSGSAVAILLNTQNALSTSGAKLLSLKNNNSEKLYVDKDGYLGFADGTVQKTGIMRAEVTLTSSNLLSNDDVLAISAPGSNKFVNVIAVQSYYYYGTSAYTGTPPSIYINYGTTNVQWSGWATYFQIVGYTANRYYPLGLSEAGGEMEAQYVTNTAVYVQVNNGSLADGDGTSKVIIYYTIESV